jgi:hypothetical protein
MERKVSLACFCATSSGILPALAASASALTIDVACSTCIFRPDRRSSARLSFRATICRQMMLTTTTAAMPTRTPRRREIVRVTSTSLGRCGMRHRCRLRNLTKKDEYLMKDGCSSLQVWALLPGPEDRHDLS